MPIEEASAQVIEHMNSRVPVYDETRGPEHIIGVVYSKDLARLMFFRPQSQRAPAAQQACHGLACIASRPSAAWPAVHGTPAAPGHARSPRRP